MSFFVGGLHVRKRQLSDTSELTTPSEQVASTRQESLAPSNSTRTRLGPVSSISTEKPEFGEAPRNWISSSKHDTVITPPSEETTKGPVSTTGLSSSGSVVDVVVSGEDVEVVDGVVVDVEPEGTDVVVDEPSDVDVVPSLTDVEVVSSSDVDVAPSSSETEVIVWSLLSTVVVEDSTDAPEVDDSDA